MFERFEKNSVGADHRAARIPGAARCGFTMVEMLVVIGIIAVLMGALSVGFMRFTKSASKANDQELVSNVAAALEFVYQQNNGRWPKALVSGASAGYLDENTAKGLVKYRKTDSGSYSLVYNPLGLVHRQSDAQTSGQVQLSGVNSKGIVSSTGAKYVPPSGTPSQNFAKESHTLRFAIDTDGDGITEVKSDSDSLRVRAIAAVWAPNASGYVVLHGHGTGENTPSVRSWANDQEVQ